MVRGAYTVIAAYTMDSNVICTGIVQQRSSTVYKKWRFPSLSDLHNLYVSKRYIFKHANIY